MKFNEFLESFRSLIDGSPEEDILPGSRYLVLSDLHMGVGGEGDDLGPNRAILSSALRDFYLPQGWTLILAGDIEELYKHKLRDIRKAWAPLYAIFEAFQAAGRLRKIVGNHDLALLREEAYPFALLHGLSLLHGGRRVFVFHGHQASRFFVKHNYLSDFVVRYLARPLRIKNTSISRDSRQRFKAERRIYRASRRLGLVSIAGHTHRPLFESLSKYDSLRWSMESLLREYPGAQGQRREEIAQTVALYREEFEGLKRRRKAGEDSRGLYEEKDFVIPCVFNSGCAIGSGGFTAIEIDAGPAAEAAGAAIGQAPGASIALVRWAEVAAAKAYIEKEALERADLEGSPWSRYVLRRDSLDSIFARIDLLGPKPEAPIAY